MNNLQDAGLLELLANPQNKDFRIAFDDLFAAKLGELFKANPGIEDKAHEEQLQKKARELAFNELRKNIKFKDQFETLDKIEKK